MACVSTSKLQSSEIGNDLGAGEDFPLKFETKRRKHYEKTPKYDAAHEGWKKARKIHTLKPGNTVEIDGETWSYEQNEKGNQNKYKRHTAKGTTIFPGLTAVLDEFRSPRPLAHSSVSEKTDASSQGTSDASSMKQQPLPFNWRWKQSYEKTNKYDTPSMLWVQARALDAKRNHGDFVEVAGSTWTLQRAENGRKSYVVASQSGKGKAVGCFPEVLVELGLLQKLPKPMQELKELVKRLCTCPRIDMSTSDSDSDSDVPLSQRKVHDSSQVQLEKGPAANVKRLLSIVKTPSEISDECDDLTVESLLKYLSRSPEAKGPLTVDGAAAALHWLAATNAQNRTLICRKGGLDVLCEALTIKSACDALMLLAEDPESCTFISTHYDSLQRVLLDTRASPDVAERGASVLEVLAKKTPQKEFGDALGGAFKEALVQCIAGTRLWPSCRAHILNVLLALPQPDEHAELYSELLSAKEPLLRDSALHALSAINANVLESHLGEFVKLTEYAGEGYATCGLKALRLLKLKEEPSELEKHRKRWEDTDKDAYAEYLQLHDEIAQAAESARSPSPLPARDADASPSVLVTLRLNEETTADSTRMWVFDCDAEGEGEIRCQSWVAHYFPSDADIAEELCKVLRIHCETEQESTSASSRVLEEIKTSFADENPCYALLSFFPAAEHGQRDASPMVIRFRAAVEFKKMPLVVWQAAAMPPPARRQESHLANSTNIYAPQWLVALEMAERIRHIYKFESWEDDGAKMFKQVDFVVFTANMLSVANQTLKRVQERRVCGVDGDADAEQRVMRYTKPRAEDLLEGFKAFKRRVKANPHTLFLLVADECHWGALKDKPHDKYVNDKELLAAQNVVVLLVSATPYCLLTNDSRIPDTPRPPSGTAAAPDPLHIVTWSATVSPDSHMRCVSEDDVKWLGEVHGRTDLEAAKVSTLLHGGQNLASSARYLSLDEIYLKPEKPLITADDNFEQIMSQEAYKGVDAGYVLALDYAFHMLHQSDDRETLAEWLIAKPFPPNKQLASGYLTAHGVEPTVDGALELMDKWDGEVPRTEAAPTAKVVNNLLDPDRVRMQVLRVSGNEVAHQVVIFLRSVRKEMQLDSRFELLGDFGDLNVNTEISQEWFESLQNKPCKQLRKGQPCSCAEFVAPTTLQQKKCDRYLDRRCKSCGHSHVRVSSYGDLGDRSVLLILVAKGRLGDTFPSTFSCLDMRARFRSSSSAMMSTLVQELGRLCRYTTDETEAPYALVSAELLADLGMKKTAGEASGGGGVVKLLADHSIRIDSHMLPLDGKASSEWVTKPPCSVGEALARMRASHKAREAGDNPASIEDGVPVGDSKCASYDAGLRNDTKKRHLHARRLLLAAEPQIGKTGAILALIEVLRLRLACKPIEAGPVLTFKDKEDDGNVAGGEYPEYNALQKKTFSHTSYSPREGKYGDPAFDDLWNFFVVEGGKAENASPELLQGGRGSTAGRRSAGAVSADDSGASGLSSTAMQLTDDGDGAERSDTVPMTAKSVTATAGQQGAHEGGEKPEAASEYDQLRYVTCDYSARGARADGAAVSRKRIDFLLPDERGQMMQCELSLTHSSWQQDWEDSPPRQDWEDSPPRLKIDEVEEEDRVLFPIITPSSGRANSALLDLSVAMQGAKYVHIVCVKHKELENYKKNFPEHSFFVLPKEADDLGVGAARFWILQLARAICPVTFPFCFVMDDNVRAWKAVQMGEKDAFFANLPFQFERFKNGKVGAKKDVPLKFVLKHFQARGFRSELHKFGMLGFDRLGRIPTGACEAYARRHVYKAVIFNLNVINDKLNYKPYIHVMEDLEFNLRVSGMERVDGGGSRRLPDEQLKGSGVWLGRDATQGADEASVLDPSDTPGPPVVCKCYGFAFHEDQGVSKSGGCAANVVASESPCPLINQSAELDPEELKMSMMECANSYKVLEEDRVKQELKRDEAWNAHDANSGDDDLFLELHKSQEALDATKAKIEDAREKCRTLGDQIIDYRKRAKVTSDGMQKGVELTLLKKATYKTMGLK